MIEVNGYRIIYNPFFECYQVSHPDIAARLAEFRTCLEAVEYCKAGERRMELGQAITRKPDNEQPTISRTVWL